MWSFPHQLLDRSTALLLEQGVFRGLLAPVAGNVLPSATGLDPPGRNVGLLSARPSDPMALLPYPGVAVALPVAAGPDMLAAGPPRPDNDLARRRRAIDHHHLGVRNRLSDDHPPGGRRRLIHHHHLWRRRCRLIHHHHLPGRRRRLLHHHHLWRRSRLVDHYRSAARPVSATDVHRTPGDQDQRAGTCCEECGLHCLPSIPSALPGRPRG